MSYSNISTVGPIENAPATINIDPRAPFRRILNIWASFDDGAHDPATIEISSDDIDWNGGVPLVLGVVHGGGMPYVFSLGPEGLGIPGTATVSLGAGGANINGYMAIQST
jgi:hypothetical protein